MFSREYKNYTLWEVSNSPQWSAKVLLESMKDILGRV